MKPKEDIIEKYFVRRVKDEFGTEARKYKTRRNDPDRLVLLPPGVAVFVELKRPDEEPNDGQLREHERLRKKGFCVYVASTKAEVDDVIAKMHVLAGLNSKDVCPQCHRGLVLLSSMKKKVCVDCKIELPWPLSENQKPLVCASR